MTTITRGRDISQEYPPVDTPRRNLDARWHAVLDGRHTYRDDHAALCALAGAAVAAGWAFYEWEAWVTADSRRGLTAAYVLREKRRGREVLRSDHRRRRLLTRVWQAAEDLAQDRPAFADPLAVRRWVEDLRRLADRHPWPGQAGNSNRLVLDALLDLALAQRTTVVTASVRAIEAQSGVTRTTASRALKRLTDRGWLSRAQEGRGEEANRYQLRRPNVGQSGTPSLPHRGDDPRVPLCRLSALDAFAPGALGRSAARVLAALDPVETSTAANLAAALGLSRRTVYRCLDALLAAGVVVRVALDGRTAGWAVREELDLDGLLAEVADAYGTTGTAQRRLDAHDREREGWRGWLAAHPRATYQTATASARTRRAAALSAATRLGEERARRRPPLPSPGERRTA